MILLVYMVILSRFHITYRERDMYYIIVIYIELLFVRFYFHNLGIILRKFCIFDREEIDTVKNRVKEWK